MAINRHRGLTEQATEAAVDPARRAPPTVRTQLPDIAEAAGP
jgi:hypothetical protein